MSSNNPGQRLRDIVDNIDAIETFMAGMEFEAFAADRKTMYAVVRALEIVSEAPRRLPTELKTDIPISIGWLWPRPAMSTGMNTRLLTKD